MSLDFRVMAFSEQEILAAPDDCRERVEEVLSGMSHEVLEDAGIIGGEAGRLIGTVPPGPKGG